jgi:HlyD family type I secretion membrane fusion protein
MAQFPVIPPGANEPTPHRPSRLTVRALHRATIFVDRLATRLLPYDATNQDAPDQRARPTILVGLTIMVVLFGFIGTWAAVVPLAAGVIAPGRVVSESNSKEIQHLEEGIVKEILVHEGDVVKAGQVLVRLDSTTAQSHNEQVRTQYITTKATEARLIAERDNKTSITFPDELTAREQTDPKVKEALDTQRRLFVARREGLLGAISATNQKIAQSNEEIRGLRDQVAADNRQMDLLNQESTVVEGLLKTGNALRPRLLALQRQQADMLGQRGQSEAMISRAQQTINESKIDMINQRNDFLNKVVAELKDTQVQISTLEEQGLASADVVRRIEITAPIAGTVTGLDVHTVGGVIQPGQTLMTLVPSNDRLVVEAHVMPTDINSVHAGLTAQVKLTAFKMRYLRAVKGTVMTVSADRFDDAKTQESYYLARIEIPQSELTDLGHLKLTPGMPADVLIVTGSRTMLSYLVHPIRESFGHAFHDQ